MKTPPLLIGAALLFWGWQAGLWWQGTIAALVLESSRVIRTRWEFPQADLNRIWDLCVLLFFGLWLFAFAMNDGVSVVTSLVGHDSLASRGEMLAKSARWVILVLLWLPLTFLPMVVVQAFSQRERMDWSTFSWLLRRQRRRGDMAPGTSSGLNVAWPFFGVCLLAASAANERTLRFSLGLVLLVGWALWSRRSPRSSVLGWGSCWLLAIALGFVTQSGLRRLQRAVQNIDSELIARLARPRHFDPKESRTMVGSAGRLNLTGRIVLRVETGHQPPPVLLRESSYKLFRAPFWASPKQDFAPLPAETDLSTWNLLPDQTANKSVIISGYLSGGEGLLAVPRGVTRIAALPAAMVETNLMGVLRVHAAPEFVRFRAEYGDGRSIDSPPDEDDSEVPMAERPAVDKVLAELHLANQTPEQRLKTIAEFFAARFVYSIWLGLDRVSLNQTALAAFLLTDHSGHCEYFATATVLLLRRAGIPARYAAGYSVRERAGDQWIVRERHAHAWCLAWVNGAWRDVDNTPGSWAEIESSRAPWWETLSDAWTRLRFLVSNWRWGPGEWKRYLVYFVVPILLLAGWRVLAQSQWSRHGRSRQTIDSPLLRLGLDSEFFQIERALAESGLERRPSETLSGWLERAVEAGIPGSGELASLLALHYRLRFDPMGLSPAERAALRSKTAAWLAHAPRA